MKIELNKEEIAEAIIEYLEKRKTISDKFATYSIQYYPVFRWSELTATIEKNHANTTK